MARRNDLLVGSKSSRNLPHGVFQLAVKIFLYCVTGVPETWAPRRKSIWEGVEY